MSKGEDKIATILKKNRIKFIREYAFKDLKYKGTMLRFDFYFVLNGRVTLVEFDGEQHFHFIKFFHKKQSTFKHLQENDRRKNKYALKHNINLYRIPYTDIDSIETLQDMLRPQYKVKSIYHNDYLKQTL